MNAFQKSIKEIFALSSQREANNIQENLFTEQYDNPSFYSTLNEDLGRFRKIKSDNDICLFKQSSLKDSFTDIISNLGKNFYILHKTSYDVKILFLNQTINKQKTRCEYHFRDNALFFASFSFTDLFNGSREEFIRKNIKACTGLNFNSSEILIKDNNGNIMTVEDGLLLKFSFFNYGEFLKHLRA